MKILFLSAYLPGRGLHGGSSRIFEILHYLHRHHEISLMCFKNRHDDSSRVRELKNMCRRVDIFLLNERRPFYLFPYEPYIDYQSEEFHHRLQKLVQKEKFDLIQFEYVQMGLFHKDVEGIPSVLTEHELGFLAALKRIPFLENPFEKIRARYNALQTMKRELEILQTVDHVICMNQHETDTVRGYLQKDNVSVLPHGLDTVYFQPDPSIEPEPFSIGFFGAYHHQPNVDAVLHFVRDIFPLVKERVPAAHFYAIGIHPPEELQRLNDRADVTVTGFVSDIRELLNKCRVVVAPLRLGLGMRVKMMEAMGMGKPVVATDLACAGFDAVDGQHVMIANTPETFSEAVCYLLQDRGCAERLGKEARKLVEEHFDFNAVGRRMEAIYQQVLDRRRTS